jgi:hypothetical protein
MCALLIITSAEGSWGLAVTAGLKLPQIHSYFMIEKKGEREGSCSPGHQFLATAVHPVFL